MNILITGGTGLIGQALIAALKTHTLTVLTRSASKAKALLPDNITFIQSLEIFDDFNDFDAIINLAGEPIVDKRWNALQKNIICHSRWDITQKLVEKINASTSPPNLFISGSAVGIYGDQANKEIDEQTQITANNFAHKVCENWEQIALQAKSKQTRVCLLRTGLVLSRNGGALKKMLPSFKLGLGGHIGEGKQFYPWIHIKDAIGAILHLLNTQDTKGVFNLTAPNPVTNKEFTKSFAKALKRPSFFFVPSCALKLALGESAHLLLDSQKVLPKALIESGYQFQFTQIDAAFAELFS